MTTLLLAEHDNKSLKDSTNKALTDAVADRVKALKEADPANVRLVPADLVTASGSGLDPHISLAGALYQAPRIARLRGVQLERVKALIEAHAQGSLLDLIGEQRVNVLELNLALQNIKS